MSRLPNSRMWQCAWHEVLESQTRSLYKTSVQEPLRSRLLPKLWKWVENTKTDPKKISSGNGQWTEDRVQSRALPCAVREFVNYPESYCQTVPKTKKWENVYELEIMKPIWISQNFFWPKLKAFYTCPQVLRSKAFPHGSSSKECHWKDGQVWFSSGGGVALDSSKPSITGSNSARQKLLARGVCAILVMALMSTLQLTRCM